MNGAYRPLAVRLGPICEPCWLRYGLVVAVGSETPDGEHCTHRPVPVRRARRIFQMVGGAS